MDQDTVNFLSDVQYMTKEQYLKAMNRFKKDWKKFISKMSQDIRNLKHNEKYIGGYEISWRAIHRNDLAALLGTKGLDDEYTQRDIDEIDGEIGFFVKSNGTLQSLRAMLSKEVTLMLANYMEHKTYLKKCAHYSYILDKLLENSNHSFV